MPNVSDKRLSSMPDRHSGQWFVLGGDVGGTATRIVLADQDGRPIRRGTAGGGNPIAHPQTAAAEVGTALHAALEGIDSGRVRTAVIGLAGGSALDQPEIRAAFERIWSESGLVCPPTYLTDPEVTFAAGSSEPAGSVLIAGTGAVAAMIRDRRIVATADGHGWLLGDEGSGFWLGREAVRATLHALDTNGRHGPLVRSVLEHVRAHAAWSPAQDQEASSGTKGPTARAPRWSSGPPSASLSSRDLINAIYGRPPVTLAEFAPLVTVASDAGDPVATDILDDAIALLTRTLTRIRTPEDDTPIVLAGSLTSEASPMGSRLRTLLRDRFKGPVLTAGDGAGGAAWLALAAAEPTAATPAARLRLVSEEGASTR